MRYQSELVEAEFIRRENRFRALVGIDGVRERVHVPNTGGERGNLIAGVLGALIRRPDLKMEILKAVDPAQIPRAKSLIESGKARILCRRQANGMHIDVRVRRGSETARAV